MVNYYRITYENIGIYQKLKEAIWMKSKEPETVWNNLKQSESFVWLDVPNVYIKKDKKYISYFTEEGYIKYMKYANSVMLEWLDEEKICVVNCSSKEMANIVYEDENQVVIEIDT